MGLEKRLWIWFLPFLSTVLYQNGLKGVSAGGSEATHCQCQCSDEETSQPSALNLTTTNLFFYNQDKGICENLPSNCNQYANCSFHTLGDCQVHCKPIRVGGCSSTQQGCCNDGKTPKTEDGKCPDDEQAPDAPSNSPVRWDLIAAGICGTALLLAVVAVVGIATYAYRHKQKQRQRRYIQDVLQLYNDTSDDSYSDGSIDDNPESNNLFDRLSRPI